jgi:multiple sugar transport system substrate-binding protein
MSTDRTTRRDFLKKSATAGAAVAGADLLASTVEAAAPAAQGETTHELVYWDWWSPVGNARMGRRYAWIKKTFEQENPGVRIKYQFIPWGDPYLQKIQASVAAGTPPDVFACSVLWARDLWDRNVLYKLNHFITMTPELQPKHFFPSAYITDSKDGTIFGVPFEGPDSDIILMNVDLMARALGWPARTPQDIWTWPDRIQTWGDFTKLAVRLTKRSGNKVKVAGFNVPDLGNIEWFTGLLKSNGSHFYKPDFSGVQLDTPQALQCAQWMLDLQKKYKVSQPPNAQRNDRVELVAGHVAMIVDGTWAPAELHDSNPKFRMMLMPIPRGPRGKTKGTVSWDNMLCMARNAKNPDLSWKFIKFMASLRTQLKRLEFIEYYAPLRNFFQTPQWKAATLKDPALAAVPLAAEVGDVYPFFHGSELAAKVGPIMSEISLGKLTPQAGLAKAQKVAERILSGI